jgi:ectoine hydroxylase
MHADDIYNSRLPDRAEIIKRQDPVIYTEKFNNPPVNKGLLTEYGENGFFVIKDFLGEECISNLMIEAEKLKDIAAHDNQIPSFKENTTNEIRSVFQIHLLNPLFKKLLTHERLVSIAKFILDDDIYIHQSRINYKPGFRGKEFYWHSDFETWHMEDGMPRMRALSVSITLTENFEFNGPLLLIPGSHHSYVQCKGETPNNHYQQSLVKQQYGIPDDTSLKTLTERNGIVSVPASPGSAIIFDCNTMHGSNGNITPFPRVNLFFVYNAVSNKLKEPYCGLPPRPEFLAVRESIFSLS